MSKPAKFTKGEAEFLAHRLTLSDALFDVVSNDSDEIEGAKAIDFDAVDRECTQLLGQIEGGWRVDMIVSTALLSPLRTKLLRDAVEGSTFVACWATDDPSQDAGRRGAIRVARSAVKKLREAGFEVDDAPVY